MKFLFFPTFNGEGEGEYGADSGGANKYRAYRHQIPKSGPDRYVR